MVNQAILKTRASHGILGSQSVLHPEGHQGKKSIISDLLLTALIDAFSILVIFLLMSFSSTGEILFINKGTELPKAMNTAMLERTPVVKVDDGKLYVEDKEVTGETLTQALLDLRTQFLELHPGEEYPGLLTVQADRRVKYEVLNQIVVAAGQAGFADLKFAALMAQ